MCKTNVYVTCISSYVDEYKLQYNKYLWLLRFLAYLSKYVILLFKHSTKKGNMGNFEEDQTVNNYSVIVNIDQCSIRFLN